MKINRVLAALVLCLTAAQALATENVVKIQHSFLQGTQWSVDFNIECLDNERRSMGTIDVLDRAVAQADDVVIQGKSFIATLDKRASYMTFSFQNRRYSTSATMVIGINERNGESTLGTVLGISESDGFYSITGNKIQSQEVKSRDYQTPLDKQKSVYSFDELNKAQAMLAKAAFNYSPDSEYGSNEESVVERLESPIMVIVTKLDRKDKESLKYCGLKGFYTRMTLYRIK